MPQKKRFLVVLGSSHPTPGCQEVEADFFSKHAYSRDDCTKIQSLRVGESCTIGSEDHVVIRVATSSRDMMSTFREDTIPGIKNNASLPLRQQMDSDDLARIEMAVNAELARLKNLHFECAAVTNNREVFDAIAKQVSDMHRAESRLRYLFIDQFPLGREENDRAGRTGLS